MTVELKCACCIHSGREIPATHVYTMHVIPVVTFPICAECATRDNGLVRCAGTIKELDHAC